MPKVDLAATPHVSRTGYPPPHDAAVAGRLNRRFAAEAGLSLLGANHVILQPGAWSSQRHWHRLADELVIMLAGEAVLVEDSGETLMRAGDIAAFPHGVENGHHLQNRSKAECVFVAISAGDEGDSGGYPDIDLLFGPAGFTRRDGTPFA